MKRFSSLFLFLGSAGLALQVQAQEATLQANFSLKTVNGVTVPVQNGLAVPSFDGQNRPVISLNGTWKKQRVTANDALTLIKRTPEAIAALETESDGRYQTDYDDSAWETKTLPGVENTLNGYETVPEYYEDGVWYRKSFFVEESLKVKKAVLKFLAVNYVGDVWINGTYVGYHEGGYTPFAFNVTSFLNFGAENKLAVRVDNPAWGTRNDIVPYGKVDWFNYTGIIHDVTLEFVPSVHIVRTDVVPQSVDGTLSVKLVTGSENQDGGSFTAEITAYQASVTAANRLSFFAGDLVGIPVTLTGETTFPVSFSSGDSLAAVEKTLMIPKPRLWVPKSPSLYILKVVLKKDGTAVDEYYTQFGIRTVTASGNKILLNGVVTFFPGVARHEDHPDYGRSVPPSVTWSDFELIKSLNVTMVRTSHYPNHPYVYQAADRIGLAIVEEIPVWQFDRPENFIIQNERRKIAHQMWREMIFRDFNRPSIFLWSGQNESLELTNRTVFLHSIHQDLDTNYPDGRLVTQSAAADRPGPEDTSQDVVDVAGWTMYFGVFYGNKAEPDTKAFLSAAQKAHPQKPILNTEYGIWDTESHNAQQKQNEVFDNTFRALEAYAARNKSGKVADTTAVMAATWWCAFDWYRHGSGAGNTGFQTMGLYQMNRTTAKTVASTLKTRYSIYALTQPVNTVVAAEQTPDGFDLEPAYPNPFNPETTIGFTLTESSPVTLTVFDVTGREIAVLISETLPAGHHVHHFNAAQSGIPLGSGLYFYRLSTPATSKTAKMILIK